MVLYGRGVSTSRCGHRRGWCCIVCAEELTSCKGVMEYVDRIFVSALTDFLAFRSLSLLKKPRRGRDLERNVVGVQDRKKQQEDDMWKGLQDYMASWDAEKRRP